MNELSSVASSDPASHAQIFRFGDFELDEHRGELLRGGRPVAIRPKPLRLLAHLVRTPDRIVPKDELLAEVWPGVVVSDSAFSTVLKQLRRALGDDGRQQATLETVRGRGVRLAARVSRHAACVSGGPSGPAARREPLYVGRVAMREGLLARLDKLDAACGAVVLLTGEPGIGKTATAEWLLRRAAERKLEVHRGACLAMHGTPPFWPFVEILRSLLETRPRPDGAFGDALARLVPGQRAAGRPPSPPSPPSPSSAEERFLTLDSIAEGIAAWSLERPLALFVDDLQWGDTATALQVELLAREAGRHPLLVVAAVRDRELRSAHPALPLLGNLARQPHCLREELEGLAAEEIGELVSAVTDERPASERVASLKSQTSGNPFFLRELLRSVRTNGAGAVPGSVRDTLRARLEALPEEVRDLLAIAATAGTTCAFELLVQASHREAAEVERAAETARRAGLVDYESPGALRFRHALVRETVYEETPAPRRVRLHRAVGQAIASLYAEDLERHLSELAHHFGEAIPGGDVSLAIEYGIRAARRAQSALAFHEALEWTGRALDWIETSAAPLPALHRQTLLARADVQAATGALEASYSTYRRVAALAEEAGDAVDLARAAIGLGGPFETGALGHADAFELLQRSYGSPASLPADLRVELSLALAYQLLLRSRVEEAAEIERPASRLAEELDDARLRAETRILQCPLSWSPGSAPSRRVELGERALEAALESRSEYLIGRARSHVLISLYEMGRFEAADRVAEALEAARHRGAAALEPFVLFYRIAKAHLEGRFDRADELVAELGALRDRMDPITATVAFASHEVERQRIAGTLDARWVDRVFAAVRAGQVPALTAFGTAYLLPECGRLDDGPRLLEAGLQPGALAHHAGRSHLVCSLAVLAIALEDRGACRHLDRELEPYDGQWVLQSPISWISSGPIARYRGLLAAALGDARGADRHLRAALAQSEALPSPPWTAQGQLDLAAWLANAGAATARREAKRLARGARDAAVQLGMAALRDRAHALASELASDETA